MAFTSCPLSSPRMKRFNASSLGWVGLGSEITMTDAKISRLRLAGFPQLQFRLNYRTTAVFTGSGYLVRSKDVVRVTKTRRLALNNLNP
jgi:hypothetical protein